MKKIYLSCMLVLLISLTGAQTTRVELYDLIKKIWPDSTGYPNVGDWDKKFPIKWNDANVVMSDDTSINFYRRGTVDMMIKGQAFSLNTQPVKWQIMLKGPRMGYTNFSIISSASRDLMNRFTLDSIFNKKDYKAILLKKCDSRGVAGYNYYQLKMPKKDLLFIKVSWVNVNGNTMIRIDGYDDWSRYAVKLDCRQ